MILHEKLSAQLPEWRERIKSLAKEHGEVKVDDVTVGQVIGGMRDIKSLLTDVSFVDPAHGILFRGLSQSCSKSCRKRAAAKCLWSVVYIICC
jgi:citrate synthase